MKCFLPRCDGNLIIPKKKKEKDQQFYYCEKGDMYLFSDIPCEKFKILPKKNGILKLTLKFNSSLDSNSIIIGQMFCPMCKSSSTEVRVLKRKRKNCLYHCYCMECKSKFSFGMNLVDFL